MNRPSSSAKRPPTMSGGRRKQKSDGIDAANHEEVEELNFRIKDRQNPVAPKGLLSSIKETVVTRGPDQKVDVKGTLTRPLTALFRRRTNAPPIPASQAQIQTHPNQDLPNADKNSMDGNDSVPEEPFDDTMSVLNLRAVSGPGGLNVNDFSAVDFQKVDDVDVSFLTRFLAHEDDIAEEQEPWTWDSLFVSVQSDMREDYLDDVNDSMDGEPPHIMVGWNS